MRGFRKPGSRRHENRRRLPSCRVRDIMAASSLAEFGEPICAPTTVQALLREGEALGTHVAKVKGMARGALAGRSPSTTARVGPPRSVRRRRDSTLGRRRWLALFLVL